MALSAFFARLDAPTRLFSVLIVIVVAARVALLVGSSLELQFDEAQYWFWSLTPDWGYFSKPPLVAWAIWLTRSLFGDAEWAVRLSAPLLQAGAAAALFVLGRALYGAWAGFWAGLGWLLIPAVWLSSSVISTDALLMPIWALSLFALHRLVEARSWRWALALGALIGLGALAKYAMLYFIGCALLAALWSKPIRGALFSRLGAIALATAVVVLSPNLLWNASHHFATVAHTAANIGASSFAFHPDELVEFIGAQALVIGPVLFAALAVLSIGVLRRRRALDERDKLLIPFIAPILIVIAAQALLSHAHANWAVTAYPAAMVWIAGRIADSRLGRIVLPLAAATHLLIGGVVAVGSLNPAFADRVGLGNALEDSRGWRATAELVAQREEAGQPFTAVMTDHRALFFELTYYWRRAGRTDLPPLRMWVLREAPGNHAEAAAPMTAALGQRVLIVHAQERYLELVAADFGRYERGEALRLPLGGGENRPLIFATGERFEPAPRDAAFLARVGN